MQKKRTKVSNRNSLGTQIFICVLISSLLTSGIVTWSVFPAMKKNTDTTTNQYMSDMAIAYGETLEKAIELMGTEDALQLPILERLFADAKIQSSENSYVYITDAEGTILYHPETNNIGNVVQNETIKGVVQNLQSSAQKKPQYLSYTENGKETLAACYTTREGNYLLVLNCNKSDVYSYLNTMQRTTILESIVSTVICCIFGIVLSIFIVGPIRQLTAKIKKLGELNFKQDEKNSKLDKRKDETGLMSQAVGVLHDELENVIGEINNNSKLLYDTAEILKHSAVESTESVSQVERAINEVAEGANSQAQETQRASDNVILIGNMIEETGKRVEQLSANAQAMEQAGDGALETLKQLDKTNEKTKQAIDNIYTQTITTNESAAKIREATGMITSIAEETNLLSLNASIEAARAGEQGRGFAVVAAQIQKLAEQSNASTKLIEKIIESLIEDSNEAVQIMTEVKEVIEEQSANVEKTGAGFTEVKQGIDSSMENMKEIQAYIDKMDEARINVVDVVQSLTAIAEENAAATEETSASAAEVSASIQNMAEQTEKLEQVAMQLENSMSAFII